MEQSLSSCKTDIRNKLKAGNIENLISALGALYILNIYYKNEIYQYVSSDLFDNRLGSEIFAATLVDAANKSISIDDSDNSIDSNEKTKLTSALCIIKYTDKSWEEMHDALTKYNSNLIEELIKEPEFKRRLGVEIYNKGEAEISDIFQTLVKEMQIEYIKKHPPLDFGKKMSNSKKEVILNKGKNVYITKNSEIYN